MRFYNTVRGLRKIITFLFEHQLNELEQLAPWNENVKAEIQHRIECQKNQE